MVRTRRADQQPVSRDHRGAKAHKGLAEEERHALDAWVRRHTVEKFGPVRSVAPLQVFEIAFDAIEASRRHKSGVAVRRARIARWRKDKTPEDADTLETLQALASTGRSP